MSFWDDTFTNNDGAPPDPNRWNLHGTPDIRNNTCEISVVGSGTQEWIQSKGIVSGDLDIQVDFERVVGGNVDAYGIDFIAMLDETHQFYARYQGGTTHYYTQAWIVGGSWQYAVSSISPVITGKLRITRSGSSCRTYRWNGAGWTEIGTARTVGNGDARISVKITNWTSFPNATFRVDNFLFNSGAPADPPPEGPPESVRRDRLDISGNVRHLADNGALQTGNVQGKIGNAAYFSGAGEQLLRLTQAPNLTGDQEFTIAFRMKPHLNLNPAADIYWHFKVGDLEIRAGFAPGQTRAFVSASTPNLSCRTGNVIPADTFSFIAVYFDTSGLYIDVNNSNEASQAGAHTGIVTPATGIEAGISAPIAMNISIDELGLWVGINALSKAQRTTLYSGNYGQRPSFN
jgi:hypothetical protein